MKMTSAPPLANSAPKYPPSPPDPITAIRIPEYQTTGWPAARGARRSQAPPLLRLSGNEHLQRVQSFLATRAERTSLRTIAFVLTPTYGPRLLRRRSARWTRPSARDLRL